MSSSPARAHSGVADVRWPALARGATSEAFALQFQLSRSEWWSPEQLQAEQLAQLRQLLRHSRREVPWVRDRLLGCGVDLSGPLTWDVFQQIPVVARPEVQAAGSALFAKALPSGHGKVSTSTTSGSTGRPLTIRKSAIAFEMWRALNARDHLWHRRDVTATAAQIRDLGPGRAGPPDGRKRRGWGREIDTLFDTGDTWSMSVSASIAEQAAWLNRIKPAYLLAYPSVIAGLLTEWGRIGVGPVGIREVRTFGEAVPDGLRERVGSMLRVRLVDAYSSAEAGVLALECPECPGSLHVQSESVILEVLRPDGSSAAPGESGQVVVTPLQNFAMPLLRYALGDMAEVGLPCGCGRGLPVLNKVMGRVRNLLTKPDGSRIWPGLGSITLHRIAPVRQWQIRQLAPDRLVMSIVASRPLTADEETALRAAIHGPLGHWFDLELREVDTIPAAARGKFEDFIGLSPT